jgi:hypothetical protein
VCVYFRTTGVCGTFFTSEPKTITKCYRFKVEYIPEEKSCDSSVGITTRLWAGLSGFEGSIPGEGWEFFSSPPCPDRLWIPPSLLSNGYMGTGGSFLGRKVVRT